MTRLGDTDAPAHESPADCDGPRALLLEAREVPLGGVRAMEVHRSLPQRALPMVGAWCFLDRFGPQTALMRVEPHPHIGLQTVTWPFVGDVRHRDTLGSDVIVQRGALNIMTSGAGIAHSEYSVGADAVPLDALQLWVALPDSRRHGGPDFERHENLPVVDVGGGARATVVVGSFAGATSPATMYTPIVGAEVHLPAGTRTTLPLDAAWEYALVAVEGAALVHTGVAASPGASEATDASRAAHSLPAEVALRDQGLLYLGIGRDEIVITAESDVTLFVLGGEPFEADIVMWWNFVGRTHEEIVAACDAWQAEAEPAVADAPGARFGRVAGHGDTRIPAPPMPAVRLTTRTRRL